MRLETRLIHHPEGTCKQTGAVNVPIYQVSTFKQKQPGRKQKFHYSRTGNPTREVLEKFIADLEGGTSGFAFSSGMAAISACLMLLKAGDHLIATEGLYGGTHRVLTRVFQDYGVSYSFVDTGDAGAVKSAFQENTRAIYVETPSNPLMTVTDIRRISSLAHENDCLVMVDNTFMTPCLQRPLDLGADVVIHSGTKFLGGHSDVVLGLAVTSSAEAASRLKLIQNAVGAVPSPLDCWLLIRGMKTLGVRLSYAQQSAGKIARWLANRPEVEQVYYPGLSFFRRRRIHSGQAGGAGAMLSFRLRSGSAPRKLLNALSVWSPAVSLGAVESIITHPVRMTHLSYPKEELKRLGVDERLIRLSVGIEAVEDLIADLEQGLGRAFASRR